LSRRTLKYCSLFRQNFVLSLKLLDAYFYSDTNYFIILDSDILTYRRPARVIEHAAGKRSFFSEDNGYRGCITPVEFEQLAGVPPTLNCNSGLLGISKDLIDLESFDNWLHSPSFWETPYERAYHYAEQTLWWLLMAQTCADSLGSGYD